MCQLPSLSRRIVSFSMTLERNCSKCSATESVPGGGSGIDQ
jgi:hypothetical protein